VRCDRSGGPYLPLGPHDFRLWLFSWLFSEVIPLHFLNIPFKWRRYPILSIYLFVSDKIYCHSFPVCFWHYAVGGAIPALLALAMAAYHIGGGFACRPFRARPAG
jgi:hypothetical protein